MERNKSFLIRKAITNYIQQLKEDQEDLKDALAALDDNRSDIPWEEVQRKCGILED